MVYEAAISFRAGLLGVALADPSTRFDPVPTVLGELPLPPDDLSLPPAKLPSPPAAVAPTTSCEAELDEAVAKQIQEEREAVERTLAHMTDVAHELKAQQRQRLTEMQQLAVELAVAIAGRLVHDRIEAGDFAVETLVHQVVERLETKQAVTVYLHPADIALLERRLGEGQALFPNNAEVRLAADDSLNRGECRAETGDVSVLSRLEEQLATIRQRLLGSLADAEIERRKAGQNLRLFPDRRQTD